MGSAPPAQTWNEETDLPCRKEFSIFLHTRSVSLFHVTIMRKLKFFGTSSREGKNFHFEKVLYLKRPVPNTFLFTRSHNNRCKMRSFYHFGRGNLIFITLFVLLICPQILYRMLIFLIFSILEGEISLFPTSGSATAQEELSKPKKQIF